MSYKFKKNEKVIITNCGSTFSTYKSAFFHFKINSYEECSSPMEIRHNCPLDYQFRIWTVKDAAWHHWGNTVVLLLQSNEIFLVIGEDGVEKIDVYNFSYYPTKEVMEDIVEIPIIKELKN